TGRPRVSALPGVGGRGQLVKEAGLAPREVHQPGCLHLQHLHEPIPAYACADDSVLVREAEQASGHKAESVNYLSLIH
ncbi:hypothetical protein ACQ4LF_24960, partial [Aeromonas salmonicida]